MIAVRRKERHMQKKVFTTRIKWLARWLRRRDARRMQVVRVPPMNVNLRAYWESRHVQDS